MKIILTKKDNEITNLGKIKDYILLKNNGNYSCEIKVFRKPRSNEQNSLYWFWLNIIGQDLGYDDDELHASFRSMFLTDNSKAIPLIRSTTVLNTLEFMTYLNKIERFCLQELNIVLPKTIEVSC